MSTGSRPRLSATPTRLGRGVRSPGRGRAARDAATPPFGGLCSIGGPIPGRPPRRGLYGSHGASLSGSAMCAPAPEFLVKIREPPSTVLLSGWVTFASRVPCLGQAVLALAAPRGALSRRAIEGRLR